MTSVAHNSVHQSTSEPVGAFDHSREHSLDATPSSPRGGKRKKLNTAESSPALSSKQRKQSQNSRPSIVHSTAQYLPPDRVSIKSDTSSLDEQLSESTSSSDRPELPPLSGKALQKVEYIVCELIDTEKTYMQDLQSILQVYMIPMEQCSALFPPDLVTDIFINIKPIGDFHLLLLERLDECRNELGSIAECFLQSEVQSGFKLYDEFCRKYPRSLDLIESLRLDKETKQFLVDCQLNAAHSFPLSEFIHRPIQRILKYPLLLREIQKHTVGTKFAEKIDAALDMITCIAIHIDNVKRIQELECNEILGWPGEPLADFGSLRLEGSFKVNGTDGRYLFLFDDLLLVTKMAKDGKYHYKSHLRSTNITFDKPPDPKKLHFELKEYDKSNKKTKPLQIHASSEAECTAWVTEIRECMLRHLGSALAENTKEYLIKGTMSSGEMFNKFNDIIAKTNYTLIPIHQAEPGVEVPEQIESPPLRDLPPTLEIGGVSSPAGEVASPSPTASEQLSFMEQIDQERRVSSTPLPQDDSGIEEPPAANQVDFRSLNVNAIRDRWLKWDKQAGSHTAPFLHTSRSPASAASASAASKTETWPLNDPNGDNRGGRTRKNKVASMMVEMGSNSSSGGNSTTAGPETAKSPEILSPGISNIISTLQTPKEEAKPVYRDIESLVAADAASSLQPDSQPLQITSPDSNLDAPFAMISPMSVDPKQSNGADDVFATEPPMEDETEAVTRRLKRCEITAGESTVKRNSMIIDKEHCKDIASFLSDQCSSDSDTGGREVAGEEGDTSDRVRAIIARRGRHKEQIEVDFRGVSGGEEAEEEEVRTSTPEIRLADSPGELYRGTALKTRPRSRTPDDRTLTRDTLTRDRDTLTRDRDTLTRDRDTLTRQTELYKGTSLIRAGAPEEEEEAVMRPDRAAPAASPRSTARSKLTIRRQQGRPGKADSSDSESEASSIKSSSTPKKKSGMVAPKKVSGLPRPKSMGPVQKSDSASSISSRSRLSSGGGRSEDSLTRPVTGSIVNTPGVKVKRAALKTRTTSFSQEDNPFHPEATSTMKRGAASAKSLPVSSCSSSTGSTPTTPRALSTPTKSNRGSRLLSDGMTRDLTEKYLSAANKKSVARTEFASVVESDPEQQELQSVRSSQLVARMKSQLLSGTPSDKLREQTGSQTLKKQRGVQRKTSQIRSLSSPAATRRSIITPPSVAKKSSEPACTRTNTVKKAAAPGVKKPAEPRKSTVTSPRTMKRPAGGQPRKNSSVQQPQQQPTRRGSTVQQPAPRRGSTTQQPGSMRGSTTQQPAPRRGSTTQQPASMRGGTVQQSQSRRGSTVQQPQSRRGSTVQQPQKRQNVTAVQAPKSAQVKRSSTIARPKTAPIPGQTATKSSSRMASPGPRGLKSPTRGLKTPSTRRVNSPAAGVRTCASSSSIASKTSGVAIKTPAKMGHRSTSDQQLHRRQTCIAAPTALAQQTQLSSSSPNVQRLQRQEAARLRREAAGGGVGLANGVKERKKYQYGTSRTYSFV